MNDEIYSEVLGDWSELKDYELQDILFKVLDHLKLSATRTNDTKHGDEQIIIKEITE